MQKIPDQARNDNSATSKLRVQNKFLSKKNNLFEKV
jgi:hypothetical protein